MRNKPEYIVCKQVAEFMKAQYPKVIYHFDLAGLNLSRAQAGMMKAIQGGRGWCDLFIAEPKLIRQDVNNIFHYHGLFLELKSGEKKIYKRDGNLISDEHIQEQYQMILKLREKGYAADFGIGLDHCMKLINNYLK